MSCEKQPVSRFQELVVVDESVTSDPRASNAANGPWSYRHVLEEMTPAGMSTSAVAREWFKEWSVAGRIGTSSISPRPLVVQKVLCPWYKQTPANACNDDCSVCSAQELDLAKAPFRLMGISYRLDQRQLSDAGEGRLSFALTNGPGDDPASLPMAMTLIFEYQLVGSRKEWAQRWHALGKFSTIDEEYKNALVDVTEGFVKRGTNPGAPAGGSSLAQIRSNEREFEWQWEFREFRITDTGLRQGLLANTPDVAHNSSQALADWVNANAAAIRVAQHSLPDSLRGALTQQGYTWKLPGVDEPLRRAFAKETCNGCHQPETEEIDANFHISPFRTGRDRLSRFVYNPEDPEHDELGLRTNMLHDALCSP